MNENRLRTLPSVGLLLAVWFEVSRGALYDAVLLFFEPLEASAP